MKDFSEILKQAGLNEAPLFDQETLKQMIERSMLDFNKHYEKPLPLISFIEDYGKTVEVLTLQNISCTMGAAKAKKTFYSTSLAASLLGDKSFAFESNLRGRELLYIDTEQAPYHVHRVGKRLKLMTGGNVSKVNVCMFRGYNPDELQELTNYLINSERGRYSFVIIDGIVDFVYDFNDLRESTKIVNKLMKWSLEGHCHINVILHTNKDALNARGHLGAFLMQKAETVFRVSKDGDITSKVSAEVTRNEPFKEFSFRIENGLPVRCDFPANYFRNPDADAKTDSPF